MYHTNRKFILPRLTVDTSIEQFKECFERRWDLSFVIDYIPDSIETLQSIDDMDVKILMLNNPRFYDAVIQLCDDYIRNVLIPTLKRDEEFDQMQWVETLDDLLNCGYYGDDYEESREEFASSFAEYWLYIMDRLMKV